MGYQPVIFFAAKDRVKSPIHVPFVKHYKATFPQIFKTQQGAMNFAERNIIYEEGVWQLPASKEVK